MIDFIQLGAVALGLMGAVFITNRRVQEIAFLCWIIANSLWVYYAVITKNPYLGVMFGFYLFCAIAGYISCMLEYKKVIEELEVESYD